MFVSKIISKSVMTDVFRKFLARGATVVNSGMFETALFEDPKNHAIQN